MGTILIDDYCDDIENVFLDSHLCGHCNLHGECQALEFVIMPPVTVSIVIEKLKATSKEYVTIWVIQVLHDGARGYVDITDINLYKIYFFFLQYRDELIFRKISVKSKNC